MFISLVGLCIFELLALLRLNGSLNWYWIFITFPLEISLGFLCVVIYKRTKVILKKNLNSKLHYYGVFGFIIITLKTVLGIITVAALGEVYSFFIEELNYIYCTVIALLTIWIPVIMYFYKPLAQKSRRLPIILIQNIMLIDTFFVNLAIQ